MAAINNQEAGVVFDGFLNLHKPLGWTSHDCVAKVRRLLQQKRVGHGGTLDPAASGVLPIALGKATRLLPYLPTHKIYRATLLLGLATDTDDLEGMILSAWDQASGRERRSPQSLTLAEIEAVLATFHGTIVQIPPRYSAIQVAGQRLYDRARAGETFAVPARQVTIERIEIRDWRSPSLATQSRLAHYPDWPLTDLRELEVVVTCGAGTYIRAIARDLGAILGVGGTLAALERTESCGFTLPTSLTLTDLASQVATHTFQPLPTKLALRHLPAIVLPSPLAKRWCQGQKLPILANGTLAPPPVDPALPSPIP
ncbi:tRNA pseudouridine(55) synthase TruB, partial [Trichothermofontia sp.]